MVASFDLDNFFDMSPEFCWIGSTEGKLQRLSAAMRRVLGWGTPIDDTRTFLEFVNNEDVSAAREALANIPAGPQTLEFVARLRQVDGSYRSVRWMGMRDPDSDRIFVRGREIQESARQEALLAAQGHYFRGLIEYSNDIILVAGIDGKLRYVSPAFERLLGFRADAWHGVNMLSLVWPEDQRTALNRFQESVHQPDVMIPWRLRVCHADGGFRWLDGAVTNHLKDPHIAGVVVNSRDVTAYVDAVEALRRSEQGLEEAQRIAGLGSWRADLRAGKVERSRAMCDLLGLDSESPIDLVQDPFSRLTDDSAKRLRPEMQRITEHGGSVEVELQMRDPNSPCKWLLMRAETECDPQGKPTAVKGTVLDITARKHAEQMMQLKDRAIATSLNGIVIADADARIVYVNPAFLRLWGFEREEDVLGKSPLEIADPERAAHIVSELHLRGVWRGEVTGHQPNGDSFDVLVAANVLLDDAGELTHMMAAVQDITESKRLQAQFLQSQKMESIGRLAGGVAHDFNNMLTVISGYVELAMLEFPDTRNLNHYLEEIQRASGSAAALTQQLLAFSRKQIIAPRVLDLNEILERIRPMLERVIGEDVQLEMIPGANLGRVRMDPSQVEQVILNLAVNARDAMPDGGKLTLETVNVELDETYSARHVGVEPGAYVVLAASDNGAGITEDVRKQLFEPFFTTKEAGKGTGLGLAMVYGAVKQNGGNVEVYSELGRGTTFKLYWPRCTDSINEVAVAKRAALPRGSETLVLVEDDSRVRKVASLMLERQGYKVHAFPNGPAALQAVATLDEPLHLLVTDVIMPEMNGQTLSEHMLAMRPNLKVLFASGYTANVIVHHGMLKDGVEFLSKPYTHAALAQRVREVLDKGRGD